jgi:hypothetical protein
MLQSRNRSLKRKSRFIAFFVIVFAGCYYRFKDFLKVVKEKTGQEEYIRDSEMMPPTVKALYE